MALIKISDPIYFGGVNLNSVPGWTTTSTDTYRYPNRSVKNAPIAYDDLSSTSAAFYTGRSITVNGVIVQNTRELLDSSIGALRLILEPIKI